MNSSISPQHYEEPVVTVNSSMKRQAKVGHYDSSTLPAHMTSLPFRQSQDSPNHEQSKLPVNGCSKRSQFQQGLSESVDLSRSNIRATGALQHAKSLDELLDFSQTGKVTIDLDPTKKSKYSKVTITASLEVLNEHVPEQDKGSEQSLSK